MTTFECVASEVLVDPRPSLHTSIVVCPACGQTVGLTGEAVNPRYSVHNEPDPLEDVNGYGRYDLLFGGNW